MKFEISEYKQFIKDIKFKIQTSQIKASIKVNEELLKLYWDIAQMIVSKQKESSWGDGLVERISKDLKREVPDMKGFSKTNLLYMKKWYLFGIVKIPHKLWEKFLKSHGDTIER